MPEVNNITPIESKRPVTMATHTITYILDGFPITTQLETSASIGDAVTMADDIAASPRENLIIEIKNIWPSVCAGINLADELMARFRKNQLEMLDDDMLRRVRLAIAM